MRRNNIHLLPKTRSQLTLIHRALNEHPLLRGHLPTPLIRAPHSLLAPQAITSPNKGSHQFLPHLFKEEFRLPGASFKIRAALWGVLKNIDRISSSGILTSSSGNFAQAVAIVAKHFKIPATIVMMSNTAPNKIEKTRQAGGEFVHIQLSGPTFQERWELTHTLQATSGALLLHPYDSVETIEANATIALELMEQSLHSPELASVNRFPIKIFVPTSGGGLAAGIAWGFHVLKNEISQNEFPIHFQPQVIAVQPAVNGSMSRSLDTGHPITVPSFSTRADALVAASPGQLPFNILSQLQIPVKLVSESDISRSHRALQDVGTTIEPSSSLSLALLKKPQSFDCSIHLLTGAN